MNPAIVETIIIGTFSFVILTLVGWGSYKSRKLDSQRDGVIAGIVKDLKDLTEKIHGLAERLGASYVKAEVFTAHCAKAEAELTEAIIDRKRDQAKLEKDLHGLGESMRTLREKVIKIETQHGLNHPGQVIGG